MNTKGAVIGAGLICLALPVVIPTPDGMPEPAWLASGLALVMALWWLTEALPLAATALLPLAAAPLLGIAPLQDIARHYSHPLVILFLGGFLLAKAIERWGLHSRLAYTLRGHAGNSPRRILAATMVATAFLSLWISNTASAMIMAPVAGAVAASHPGRTGFGTAMMLGVAFAATIGGMGSLIGTPPNAFFAAHVGTAYGVEIGFAQWAAVGVPISAILLAAAWAVLGLMTPGMRKDPLGAAFEVDLGKMSGAERMVAIVAGLTALAWISRPLLGAFFPAVPLTDAGIAMIAALALFIIPAGDGRRLLDWNSVATLRWDVLILFGGGLALAGILEQTGLVGWVGDQSEVLRALPGIVLALVIASVIVYVGELASNTAMAAIFLPVAGATATALGIEPIGFMFPVALAASVGFMLPVATPPNAIVYAYPYVTRANMLRAGAPLDLIGILVAVGVSRLLGPLVLG